LDCNEINQFGKYIKAMERDINKINLGIKCTGNDSIMSAYIIGINDCKLTIYIVQYKIVHYMNIFDKQFVDMVTIINDDMEIKLINNVTNEYLILKKYEMIFVNVHLSLYNDEINKKVKVSIPIIKDFLFKLSQT
jgi:hypothetical protein